MPNWCDNVVYIYKSEHVSPDLYKELVRACDDSRLLDFLHPMPQELRDGYAANHSDDRWYHWANKHWGTKWDVDSPTVFKDDDYSIGISFSTAWAAPLGAFEHAHNKWGLEYHLMFHEPGVELLGEATHHGEEYYDFPSNWDSKEDIKNALRRIPQEIIDAFDLKELWREIYNDNRENR